MDRKCNIIDCENIISRMKPSITEENLINISNKGIYKRGMKDADEVTEAEISYNEGFVVVKYGDIQVSVKDDMKGVLCSCKSKTVCRHVITAFIIMQECDVETADTPDIIQTESKSDEKSEKEEEKIQINRDYLNEIIGYIDTVMKKGIINCNSTDIDISSQLSVKGENTVHNNISLMMRNFSLSIGNMLEKSAEFSSVNVFHLVCRIYNTAKSVLNNENNRENLKILVSGGKDSYTDREILTFHGLGAYPWSSNSGYAGVTALLYCEEDKKIYTYATSIAFIHEKTKKYSSVTGITDLYKNHSHWQNSASLNQISSCSFKLFGCKTNNSGRLSSSKSTVMNVLGFNKYDKTEIMKLSPENMLNGAEKYDYFSERRDEQVCTVKFEGFNRISYNKIRQLLEFEIYDGQNVYPCEIAWSELNRTGISYIEEMANKGIRNRTFMVCRYKRGIFIPVSIINDDKVRNIFFE